MQKAYADRTFWENEPSDRSPINEQNLNKISAGLDTVDDRVIVLDSTKLDKTTANSLVRDVSLDMSNGVITVTYLSGATQTFDTKLEKLAVNFRYDKATQQLVITLDDGTEQFVDLTSLISQYEFLESGTIAFEISTDGKVKAIVKEGSIEERHLRPDYLADIRVESGKAEAARDAAKASELAAAQSETNAAKSAAEAASSATAAKASEDAAMLSQDAAAASATAAAQSQEAAKSSEVAAKQSEDNASASKDAAAKSEQAAADSATEAESYAHGGTGTREGEDTDNSQHYAEQAKNYAAAAESAAKISVPEFYIDFDTGHLKSRTEAKGIAFKVISGHLWGKVVA